MTPVETFSPHFSNALAKYIARTAKEAAVAARARASSSRGSRHRGGDVGGMPRESGTHEEGDGLVIYEAGGGTGTNALNVLNWLKREEPKLYARTEYTIIEISGMLAERQTERVCTEHKVSQAIGKGNLCGCVGYSAWMVPRRRRDRASIYLRRTGLGS